jgi:hypothetical protein
MLYILAKALGVWCAFAHYRCIISVMLCFAAVIRLLIASRLFVAYCGLIWRLLWSDSRKIGFLCGENWLNVGQSNYSFHLP